MEDCCAGSWTVCWCNGSSCKALEGEPSSMVSWSERTLANQTWNATYHTNRSWSRLGHWDPATWPHSWADSAMTTGHCPDLEEHHNPSKVQLHAGQIFQPFTRTHDQMQTNWCNVRKDAIHIYCLLSLEETQNRRAQDTNQHKRRVPSSLNTSLNWALPPLSPPSTIRNFKIERTKSKLN